jgi:hypothetical protein
MQKTIIINRLSEQINRKKVEFRSKKIKESDNLCKTKTDFTFLKFRK